MLRRLGGLPPPVLPLARHVRGADDLDVWVNQKERNNLSVPGRRGVGEFERVNTMLECVRKREEPPFACVDAAHVLDRWVILPGSVDDR